jgi:hypothetical protein
MTYLINEYGRPLTAGGFGGWLRSCCKQAGVLGTWPS